MSDHEFEKKVQQKMEELKLRPSDAVWTEVERNLRRDKRRRRTLLWLPIVGVLLTGGYFLVTATGNGQQDTLAGEKTVQPAPKPATPQSSVPENVTTGSATVSVPEREPVSTNPASSSTNKPATSLSENTTPSNQPETQTIARIPAADKNRTPIAGKNVVTNRSNKNSVRPDAVVSKSQGISSQTPRNDGSNPDRGVKNSSGNNKNVADASTTAGVEGTGSDKTNNNVRSNSADPGPTKAATETQTTSVDPTTDEAKKSAGINAKESVTAVDSAANKNISKDSASNKPLKQAEKKAVAKTNYPKQSNWQWGVMANAGAANISEGNVFDLLKAVRVDDLANAPRVYNGIPAAPAPEASPIRTGATFSAGAFVQRRLSNRISLSLGLQYTYVSVYTQVGKRVDSTVSVNFGSFNNQSQLADRYYGGANTMYEYTNRYHFIEMPLMAHWRFMRISNSPIVLDAGISVSRLFSTNALHFDGFNGVYYENDDFFNRTHLGLNAGLGVGLFQRSKHPLFIGPNIRYYTSGLVKEEVTSSGAKQHIWSFGLNAKMLLKK